VTGVRVYYEATDAGGCGEKGKRKLRELARTDVSSLSLFPHCRAWAKGEKRRDDVSPAMLDYKRVETEKGGGGASLLLQTVRAQRVALPLRIRLACFRKKKKRGGAFASFRLRDNRTDLKRGGEGKGFALDLHCLLKPGNGQWRPGQEGEKEKTV